MEMIPRSCHPPAFAMRSVGRFVLKGAPVTRPSPSAPLKNLPPSPETDFWRHTRLGAKAVRCASGNGAASEGKYDYDLFTIGAGSGGVRAARQSAARGVKVAICELPYAYISSETAGGLGGTCVLRGCVPKKLMVYGSEFATEFRDSRGFGWNMEQSPQHNWHVLLQNKRKELDRLNGIYRGLLEGAGVETMEGRGTLVDAHTVEVNGKKYTAKYIVVATGGRAQRLNIPGAEHTITSDEALELEQCPKKIVVLGGGYIAVEFAGIFNSFSAETHVVYRADRPLRGFDEEVRTFIAEQFREEGLNLHAGCTPTEIKRNANGTLDIIVKNKDGETVMINGADQVLMATGRKPNTAGLGLEEIGVELDAKAAIKVNALSQSTVPSIYAVGDVTNRIALTPVALMEAMALSKTLFDNEPTEPDHKNVASAVFSQPPLATVGFTEEEAIKEFGDVDIYTSTFRPLKNTLSGNNGRTLTKLVVDVKSDRVVGVHMVGHDCAEIMQGMGVAVKMGVTKQQLDSVVGIHPSSAEEFVTMRTVTRRIRDKELVNVA